MALPFFFGKNIKVPFDIPKYSVRGRLISPLTIENISLIEES